MFLLIDNYDSFTYNLAQAFQILGKDPIVLKNDDLRLIEMARRPDLELVCISPGPGHPSRAGLCPQFLQLLDPQIPVLGICLGHQLLGMHAGADIAIAPQIMHGKQSEITHDGKGIFQGLPNPMPVGRYHSLIVRENDESAGKFRVAARGPDGEVMALAYNDRPWVGAQFHPESVLTPQGLDFLANFPENVAPPVYTPARILEHVAAGIDMGEDMAAQAFGALMDGELAPSQAGALLMGLRMKGVSPSELAQAREQALKRAIPVEIEAEKSIDIVGTGGDGKNSFNCSTAAALTLAGMGYKVVKHGNRAVSSTCGAADALEGLGIKLVAEPEAVRESLAKRNFTFLFAPYFHPAFKAVGQVRKELGVRTLFNILGPMINPARSSHLLMGVARPDLVDLVASALAASGPRRAGVVCGAGGYDEITPLGQNRLALVADGEIREMIIDPARYGIPPCRPEDLACHSKEEAIETLRAILAGGGPQPMRDMVQLNAGAAIYIIEEDISMDEAMRRADAAIRSGAGMKVLANA